MADKRPFRSRRFWKHKIKARTLSPAGSLRIFFGSVPRRVGTLSIGTGREEDGDPNGIVAHIRNENCQADHEQQADKRGDQQISEAASLVVRILLLAILILHDAF